METKGKHTPGPWEARGGYVLDGAGNAVAIACLPRELEPDVTRRPGESWLDMRARTEPARRERDARMERNARLIAAAPALFDALEQLVEEQDIPEENCTCHLRPPCGDCEEYSYLRELVENARAAIAAAKGETP